MKGFCNYVYSIFVKQTSNNDLDTFFIEFLTAIVIPMIAHVSNDA